MIVIYITIILIEFINLIIGNIVALKAFYLFLLNKAKGIKGKRIPIIFYKEVVEIKAEIEEVNSPGRSTI